MLNLDQHCILIRKKNNNPLLLFSLKNKHFSRLCRFMYIRVWFFKRFTALCFSVLGFIVSFTVKYHCSNHIFGRMLFCYIPWESWEAQKRGRQVSLIKLMPVFWFLCAENLSFCMKGTCKISVRLDKISFLQQRVITQDWGLFSVIYMLLNSVQNLKWIWMLSSVSTPHPPLFSCPSCSDNLYSYFIPSVENSTLVPNPNLFYQHPMLTISPVLFFISFNQLSDFHYLGHWFPR